MNSQLVRSVVLLSALILSLPAWDRLKLSAGELDVIHRPVVVEVGDRPRIDVPVSLLLDLKKNTKPVPVGAVRLIETTGGKDLLVPSQIEPGTPSRLWWILQGETPVRSKRTFRIDRESTVREPDAKRLGAAGITVERRPDFLEMRHGLSPVLRDNTAHIEPPKGVDPKYGRSGHIHPVWTPKGSIVTEQFPADHPHQSGIFLAHVKTEFEGRTPDFWNLLGGTGKVRFKAIHGTTNGPVFGEFEVEHEHVDLSATPPKVALFETWNVRVWNTGGPESGFWTCDITSRLKCATPSPIKIPKYHYGGMALRGATSWAGDRPRFLTSEGKDRIAGNHSRPRWCDLSGPVGDRTAGLAFLTHPQNPRFPEPLRIHPTMPYMVYTPAHLGDWELTPGLENVVRYRFLIHDGDLPSPTIDRQFSDFSEPLVARFAASN